MFIYFVRMLLKHLHALSRVDPSFIVVKNLVVKVGIWMFLRRQPTRMKWEKRSSIKNFFFFKDMKLS
jgi:ABC-type antimicrobial peptide transport system ATPase subunit